MLSILLLLFIGGTIVCDMVAPNDFNVILNQHGFVLDLCFFASLS
jgi:hypothetical protein